MVLSAKAKGFRHDSFSEHRKNDSGGQGSLGWDFCLPCHLVVAVFNL